MRGFRAPQTDVGILHSQGNMSCYFTAPDQVGTIVGLQSAGGRRVRGKTTLDLDFLRSEIIGIVDVPDAPHTYFGNTVENKSLYQPY